MRKFNNFAARWLMLFFAALALSSGGFALAEGDANNLKVGKSSGNDADLANIFSVRQDYFKRYPFAKNEEDYRKRGRKNDDTKEQRGSEYKLKANGVTLTIPPGPLVSQETGEPKSPDPYIAKRPQYRPLFAYCGGAPGKFLPQPQPGMLGTYVPNYNKVASGEGGNVEIDIPRAPVCYVQPLLQMDNSKNQSQEGDQGEFEYELTTFGVGPISDTQFQMLDRENNQRFLELFFDPERWLWTARAAAIMQQQQAATNVANTADHQFDTATAEISEYLINVANEEAAVKATGHEPKKLRQQAVYMVQQMYHHVFVPMAVLLLLPGAVMTQMKGMVQFGVLKTEEGTETSTPFQGIIKSIIAIFLIPATQLIVSYMIDVGNSLAYETRKWVDLDLIRKYAHEQIYGPRRSKTYNCLVEKLESSNEGAIEDGLESNGIDLGKMYGGAEKDSVEEKTPQLSKQVQLIYNVANMGMAVSLMVLADFQLVMMCYLFLLGPIAAAFYAWPLISKQTSSGPGLFNAVFANWLDAVVVLSLWRFWWCVVLACLTTYIRWNQDMGYFDIHSQWEMMVLTSFNVLLSVIPFQPFSFNPGPYVSRMEQAAEKGTGGSTGGGSAGGGGGGAGGGDGGGGASGQGGSSPSAAPSSPDVTVTASTTTSAPDSGGNAPAPASDSGSKAPDSSGGPNTALTSPTGTVGSGSINPGAGKSAPTAAPASTPPPPASIAESTTGSTGTGSVTPKPPDDKDDGPPKSSKGGS
ncbi:MAG: hypothetical protein K2X77_23210 [Candidatus Obscuribacterales bacterium]|jgi:hypothetical protein|nr:hypothetical protein [Candidatus Obscuribacterales bacterium]